MAEALPIYIVDDDADIRAVIRFVCEEEGMACTEFPGGEEFLAALDGLVPGPVLLDMRMPRRNGIAVQTEMARRGRRLPVVAITGYGDVDLAVQSMRLGAVEFLEKPFTDDILLRAIAAAAAQLGDD